MLQKQLIMQVLLISENYNCRTGRVVIKHNFFHVLKHTGSYSTTGMLLELGGR
jgi:hypothetical protein